MPRTGFVNRTLELDKLITEAKKRKLASQESIATGNQATDIATARIGATSREKVAGISGDYGIRQEQIQQEGTTARENLTIAGNKVLQELQGRQDIERERVSGTQSIQKVREVGVQARETAKQKNKFSREYLNYVLENLGEKGLSQTLGYTYDPTNSTSSEDEEVQQYASF